MNNKEIEFLLHRLEGQIIATQAAIRGVILAHSHPELCLAAAADLIDRAAATLLANPVSEHQLTGCETAKTRILPSAADLARRHGRHPPG